MSKPTPKTTATWPKPDWECEGVRLYCADCLELLPQLPAGCIDAVVTDPPYGLRFMGQVWDHGVPGMAFWQAILATCKPGAHLLAFGGTRTFHRLTCAIEDADWEIRDCLMWLYGSGFPKSLDVGKAIDKAAGVEREVVGVESKVPERPITSNWRRSAALPSTMPLPGSAPNPGCLRNITVPAIEAAKQWDGWGTGLKPTWEPITLARKPLDGTVANNVLTHGCGALNVDGCRVPGGVTDNWARCVGQGRGHKETRGRGMYHGVGGVLTPVHPKGRFPANVIHDGSEEVLAGFPVADGKTGMTQHASGTGAVYGGFHRSGQSLNRDGRGDVGSVARFFYCAKADKKDRGKGNNHPTVKPTDLLRYLCRLIAPTGGVLLDPFLGSGTTGVACVQTGREFIGIEIEPKYFDIAVTRIDQERRQARMKFA